MGSVAHAPVRQLVRFAPLGAMSLVARPRTSGPWTLVPARAVEIA